uniref:IQ motif and ubiquitin domain containing n=1 Tax=Cynoglossus semilaevis TaxID=244447 RepID=A0A3P8UIV3_CYNSE
MMRQREGENGEEMKSRSPRPGGGGAEEQPEREQEPEDDREEKHDAAIITTTTTDVINKVEEAETQTDDDKPEGETQTEDKDAEECGEQEEIADTVQTTEENVGNSTATVKVVLVPEGHVMTVAFVIGLSIQELKCHLSSELRVPVEVLQISLDGKVLQDQWSLMELGVRPHSSTRLEMSSTDPTSHPLRPLHPPEQDNMPDFITVRVPTDDGGFREVVVEIQCRAQRKAFMGGFRHRLTGREFHHAAVQTLPKKRPDRGVDRFSRETQTQTGKLQVQQTPITVSTQTTRIGCYGSCMNDRFITPGNYITAEQYHDRRLRAVICLQSHVRRWMAMKTVDEMRRARDRRLIWMELRERRKIEEKEEQLRDRYQHWIRPQKKEDLNLLYHALENWRREEEQRINSSLQGAERKAALCMLFEQETQLIATIERHGIAVEKDNYEKAIKNFLDKSAAPHRWRGADGRMIEMDNQNTIRARELRDLYNDVILPSSSQEQRRHVLMTLKRTVKEHECRLTRDIVQLIDREMDLMSKRVRGSKLEGLRTRICTLFLQYIKTPEFNPEVSKLLKAPAKSSHDKNQILRCISCHCYKSSTEVTLAANARLSGRCQDCYRLDNMARWHIELFCYRNILSKLRANELQFNEDAKIPFLLQVEDVQHLVEKIWASCSVLNGSKDLYDLRFIRWNREREWSPWNCILLTTEESTAHLEIKDVHKAYAAAFIHGIEYKHMLARRHFRQNPVIAEYLDYQPTGIRATQFMSKLITSTSEYSSDGRSDALQ